MASAAPHSPSKTTLMVFYCTPIYSSYISPPIDCHSKPKLPLVVEIVAAKVGACSETKVCSSGMIGHWQSRNQKLFFHTSLLDGNRH
mmetsp:Transcript_21036/g.34396  ORF Transcript_21036/g.34396 Transcript_21036/m.34396 type:complete len:87 (-) Transcript_21036:72-332(-)